MRGSRTRLILAITAVMVVTWSGIAVGANGDAIRAGQTTTATNTTNLNVTESGNAIGFFVQLGGSSTGPAIKGTNNASGNGISGVATSPDGIGNFSQNNSASRGTGAAGLFDGGQNDGVKGITKHADGFGGFFRNQTVGVGTSGVGAVALGRSHTLSELSIGPDGFDGAIEAAGPNGIEGNSISPGGFGVTGDGPAVGVNGTATDAGGTGGNFTGGSAGIGVNASGGATGVAAEGGTTGGVFTGDIVGVDVAVNDVSGIGLEVTLIGDTDGNGFADDDANNAINASSDDTNNAAVIIASTPTGSSELSHEAIETFGFLDVNGNARVTGNLDVVGTCCGPTIDHPLDPANFYLRHAAVSSPAMKNMYDGMVTTDSQGIATVTLPAYFPALNKNFRYQLTVIGKTFAQAIVWKEIAQEGRSFQIRTSEPGVKVSWQVTGIREDAYARAHPLQVIERKTGAAAGRYLHPELFGHPNAKPLGLDMGQSKSRAQAAEMVARKAQEALRDAARAQRQKPTRPADVTHG